MTVPPLRGVYLRPLPDPLVPARHSAGARSRATQLQTFLRPLHAVAAARLPLHGEITLSVVGRDDWRRAYHHPYGFPFTRTRPTPASRAGAGGPQVDVVVPADYPGRLVRRFDEVLLRAARAGVPLPTQPLRGPAAVESPAPAGDVRELLDLVVGHEWGHAVAVLSGLRLRVHWLDELVATVIYLAALRDVGQGAVVERLLAWAAVQAAGGDDERRDLGAFEYPRGRLRLPRATYFQGVFTLRAWALVSGRGLADGAGHAAGDALAGSGGLACGDGPAHAEAARDPWAFVLALHEAVAPVASPSGRHRGDVARALVAVEPSFRDWFATFGEG